MGIEEKRHFTRIFLKTNRTQLKINFSYVYLECRSLKVPFQSWKTSVIVGEERERKKKKRFGHILMTWENHNLFEK